MEISSNATVQAKNDTHVKKINHQTRTKIEIIEIKSVVLDKSRVCP